jgi:tetratricopeptide repeat protein 30
VRVVLQYVQHFLEALIIRQTAPEEAYKKLDEMAAQLTESLRICTKQVKKMSTN